MDIITERIKIVTCNNHNLTFIRNIYGDEINNLSPIGKTYRSEWQCTKCGKIKYKQYLNKSY